MSERHSALWTSNASAWMNRWIVNRELSCKVTTHLNRSRRGDRHCYDHRSGAGDEVLCLLCRCVNCPPLFLVFLCCGDRCGRGGGSCSGAIELSIAHTKLLQDFSSCSGQGCGVQQRSTTRQTRSSYRLVPCELSRMTRR